MAATSAPVKSPVTTIPGKMNYRATYMIIHSKDVMNFTVSSNTIALVDMIMTAFSNNKKGVPVAPTKAGKLTLQNHISHASKIEFFVKNVRYVLKMMDHQLNDAEIECTLVSGRR